MSYCIAHILFETNTLAIPTPELSEGSNLFIKLVLSALILGTVLPFGLDTFGFKSLKTKINICNEKIKDFLDRYIFVFLEMLFPFMVIPVILNLFLEQQMSAVTLLKQGGEMFVFAYCFTLLYVKFFTNIPLKNYVKYTFLTNVKSGLMGSEVGLPETCKAMNKLGFDEEKTNLVAPLGTNMSVVGTAIGMGLYFHFVGGSIDIFSLKFLGLILFIVPVNLMFAPGVPFINVYILSALMGYCGGSLQYLGIILGIDRIIDILLTILNVNFNILTVYELHAKKRVFPQIVFGMILSFIRKLFRIS
jgi:Na+/H+-dicarboxylate symporter